MFNKLEKVEQAIRKIGNLQQNFAKLNQLNWKICNDLKRLQADLEWMMHDYTKMEESNMQQ